MTVKKTQKILNTTLEKTEQSLNGLETALESNVGGSLLTFGEQGEANEKNAGLPEGWVMPRMGDLAQIITKGTTPTTAGFKYTESGIPFIKVENIGKNGIELSSVHQFISDEAHASLKRSQFEVDDVLFSIAGTIGKTALVSQADLPANTNQAVAIIRGVSDFFDPKFLRLQLTEASSRIAKEKARGGGMNNVSLGDLKSLDVLLPPLAEQTVIAQTLDTLLAQVDNIKSRLDAIPKILKTFRQSVLAAAVSGKLTEEWRGENECGQINLNSVKSFWVSQYEVQGKKMPKAKYVESHKLGAIPSSWVATKIGEVFDVYVGATPSRANKKYWSGNIPWVSSSEVAFCKIKSVKEFITQDGLDNTSTNLHPIGTVMLAMIGQGKTRGQAAILKLEACHNQNTAAMRVPQGFALSEYLYFFLFKQYEETRRAGGGNNQQALNKSSVQSLPFPLPPLEEQTQIVHRVEELFAFAEQIEQQVKNAQRRVSNLTQSILAKAFRGELTAQWRVENPDLISGENSAEALLANIQEEREKLKPKKVIRKKADRSQV